jgi:hypothetical protein
MAAMLSAENMRRPNQADDRDIGREDSDDADAALCFQLC